MDQSKGGVVNIKQLEKIRKLYNCGLSIVLVVLGLLEIPRNPKMACFFFMLAFYIGI